MYVNSFCLISLPQKKLSATAKLQGSSQCQCLQSFDILSNCVQLSAFVHITLIYIVHTSFYCHWSGNETHVFKKYTYDRFTVVVLVVDSDENTVLGVRIFHRHGFTS